MASRLAVVDLAVLARLGTTPTLLRPDRAMTFAR